MGGVVQVFLVLCGECVILFRRTACFPWKCAKHLDRREAAKKGGKEGGGNFTEHPDNVAIKRIRANA